MRPITLSKVLVAASATNICASQALAAAGFLNLNGSTSVAASGVSGGFGYVPKQAVLDTQRRVLFTSGGNDSTKTATIIGTNDYGGVIAENVTLANATTATSLLDYKTVLSIFVNGAIATTITVGTNTTGSTPWIMPNYDLDPFAANVATQVSGSVTFQGETTLDDYFTEPNNVGIGNLTPTINVAAPIIASGSAANVTALVSPFRGFRLTVTAGTGTVTAQFLQAGIIN